MNQRLYLVEQSALEVGGHYYAYTRTVAAGARSLGLDVTILQNRRFRGDWKVDGADIVSAFRYTWGEANHMWLRDFAPDQIAYDFHQAVRARPPVEGDHVLFSTLSNAELRALLDYLLVLPAGGKHPTYHILLRFDPQEMEDGWEHYQNLFRRVATSAQLRRVLRFHADTDPLSKVYARLTGIPFSTLPIPFAQTRLKARLAEARQPTEPLVVTYLGDARLEKKFADIPDAVAYLWKDYVSTGRVRFVLQSHFNVDGGEHGMLQAVQRLGQFPVSMVQLIDRPLETDQYYDVLADADIVLVPYDATRYRARSSGILIEAMAAGKPVITTCDSWMATQVTAEHSVVYSSPRELGPAIKIAVDNFTKLNATAKSVAPPIMDHSSGENFVRVLLSSASNKSLANRPGPRVLYIIDGGTLILRNGAGLTAIGQLNYLSSANYRITVLAIMGNSNLSGEDRDAWVATVNERVGPFDLEGLFIAGAGRLSTDIASQRKSREHNGGSIVEDIDDVGRFDVNLEFIDHIRQMRPNLIMLNYVVNIPIVEKLGLQDIPIICETHDIQSFQKAIYSRRAVDLDDVDAEIKLLARCHHLISVSNSETAYILENLPDAKITTIGMSSEVKPLGVRRLAGAKNLAEVLSTCGPALLEYQWDPPTRFERSAEMLRLAKCASIDLVYFSSNKISDAGDLRWFLDNIYIPNLAPLGISFVVAGSIDESSAWPTHENLFIVGCLDRLEPLYAAARVVVEPVIEGAGAAVKLMEALTYGRPVVATSLALRGVEEALGGVALADTPAAMSLAIHQLLSSSTLWRARAMEARRTAREFVNPMLRYGLLDRVFQDALGDRARPTVDEPDLPVDDDLGMWTPTVEHVNRLVRNWLENEPLESASLQILLERSREDVEAVVHAVVKALLVDRDAPGLWTERRIIRAAAGRDRQDADFAIGVILRALDARRPSKAVGAAKKEAVIVFDARHGVTATALNTGTQVSWRRPHHDPVPLEALESTSLVMTPLLRYQEARSFLVSATVESNHDLPGALISQEILFSGDGNNISSLKQVGSVLRRQTDPSLGGNVSMAMPEFYSAFCSKRIIDIFIDADQPPKMDIEFDGVVVEPIRLGTQAEQVLRFYFDGPSSTPLSLSVTVQSGAGVLRKIVQHLALGDDFELVLAALDRVWGVSSAQLGDEGGSAADEPALIVQELGDVLRRQIGLPRLRALSLRKVLGPDVELRIAQIIKGNAIQHFSERESARLADVLDAKRLMSTVGPGQQERRLIASRGLTMSVHAEFASEREVAGTTCVLDDVEASLLHTEGNVKIWQIDGRAPTISDTWIRHMNFISAKGEPIEPTSVRAKFRFVAAHDRATGQDFVSLSNAYAAEMYNPDAGIVWTGPKLSSRFTLPLAITASGQLSINLANVGDNWAAEDLGVQLNGVPLTTAIEYQGGGASISGPFVADPEGLLTTELNLSVSRLHTPPGESRQLGVALNWIEFSILVE